MVLPDLREAARLGPLAPPPTAHSGFPYWRQREKNLSYREADRRERESEREKGRDMGEMGRDRESEETGCERRG